MAPAVKEMVALPFFCDGRWEAKPNESLFPAENQDLELPCAIAICQRLSDNRQPRRSADIGLTCPMRKAIHQIPCVFRHRAGRVVSGNERLEWNVERSVQFIQDHQLMAGKNLAANALPVGPVV